MAAEDKDSLVELAALLATLPPQGMAYPAQVLKALRALPDGFLTRKLTENIAGWSSLDAAERNARHLRALAIVGDALRTPLPLAERANAAETPAPEPASELPAVIPYDFTIDETPLELGAWRTASETLSQPLKTLKGIGPKRAETLAAKGLITVGDLLTFLPYRYDLRTERHTLRGVPTGTGVLVSGHVLARGAAHMRRFPHAYRLEIGLDSAERIAAMWFHASRPQQEFYARKFPIGAAIEAAGTLDFFDGRPSLNHPELGLPDTLERGLLPVYSEIEGTSSKLIRQWVALALETVHGRIPEPLPPDLRTRYKLISREMALTALHRPQSTAHNPLDPTYPPRRRLVFDEFFYLSLGLLIRRRGAQREMGIVLSGSAAVVDEVTKSLPFALTKAQSRVIEEAGRDLESGHPMHRLVQGDVGSGKTLIAFALAAVALRQGRQAAMMAPTELLAEQHLRSAHRYLPAFQGSVALLTGSTGAKARRELAARLQSGEPLLLIGTHALLEDEVTMPGLALAVIDEQHRFGVRQRAKLVSMGAEGKQPHLLVMTATPIPRTLAMTLYGDLDVSVVDELPPGRTPVETRLVVSEPDRKALLAAVKTELAAGRQVYWVFPLIEESEKVELKDATRAAALLQTTLPDYNVQLLHGRMAPAEKEAVMQRFIAGDIGVLVATTVIEVGVDVPNASVMVVENADRFGLSQLHQLRGRVGRGAARSYCYLRIDQAPFGDVAQRLRVMTETNDGFRLAEADLEIRGAGDLLGTRQSGLPSMHVANPVRDQRTLAEAREAAESLLVRDPDLKLPEHGPMRELLEAAWSGRLQLATSG